MLDQHRTETIAQSHARKQEARGITVGQPVVVDRGLPAGADPYMAVVVRAVPGIVDTLLVIPSGMGAKDTRKVCADQCRPLTRAEASSGRSKRA